ncbi:Uncharacterised protein [Neisseria meningitidis]|nr:Uncharacterised protein [Neisseria meningitidis]
MGMRHNQFGGGVVAAVAAYGEAVEQVRFLRHMVQVAQVCAAADEEVGVIGVVAGNQFGGTVFSGLSEPA